MDNTASDTLIDVDDNTDPESTIPETETTPVNLPNTYDVIIVGGGPAGLTAGLYAARGGQKTLILEGIMESSTVMPGGQLRLTPEIENFPGFAGGEGSELVDVIRHQALSFGAEIIGEKATNIDLSGTVKLVTGSDFPGIGEEQTHHGRAVILATGAVARRLSVPGEDENFGRGVSTCATCDGFFFKGGKVTVVGGGDTAIEDALYLTSLAEEVTLVHRRDQFKAKGKDVEKLLSRPNINIIWHSVIEEVVDVGGKVTGTTVKNTQTGETTFVPSQGLFVAIGHDPATELLANKEGAYILDLTESGYVVANSNTAETSIPGFYVAGDVSDDRYRQAVTAAASGCKAAMDAIAYLG